MTRQLAFLMRASKGGLTHPVILSLTWRQFQVYLDSFTWLLREESEDGRKKNYRDDLEAMTKVPELKERKKEDAEDIKSKIAAFNERWKGKKGTVVDVLQLPRE